MSEYPFNLKGRQENFKGSGSKDGEPEQSREFILEQGVVIAEIEHHGYGDFKLKFVPTGGFSEGGAAAASIGGSLATGAAAGAAAGSIIPVAGTIAGALIGGVAGYFAGGKVGEAINDAIAPTVWTPVDYQGEFKTWCIVQVKENEENSEDEEGFLAPGKYCLEVESKDRWTCRFIQPDLGQSSDNIVSEVAENYDLNEDGLDAGRYILGPFKSGSRPVLAHIRHSGRGAFYAAAHSVDGTHQCLIFYQEGQFLVEDQQTEIRPGKEYFFYIEADGECNMDFTGGY